MDIKINYTAQSDILHTIFYIDNFTQKTNNYLFCFRTD